MSNDVNSRCGNQCNLCLIYRPNVEIEDRRIEICAVWDKLGSIKYDPATMICEGCFSDKMTDNGCKARTCVIDKGLLHCGYCDDYPCAQFPAEPDAEAFYKDMVCRGVNWTVTDDKMMNPYNPKKIIDEWKKRQK